MNTYPQQIQPPNVSGYKSRRMIFWILAALSVALILGGASASDNAVNEVKEENAATAQNETQQAAGDLGAEIGGGIVFTMFLCAGGVGLVLFSLLAWRNGVGLRSAMRHYEQMQQMQMMQQGGQYPQPGSSPPIG